MASKKSSFGKRQTHNVLVDEKYDSEERSYTDFMCPICLQLLIQPVVMPCNHELCMPCFKAHVQSTSLCCPMCRIRISNWARTMSRKGELVDKKRWKYIQSLFPDRCKRRLNGEEEEDDDCLITSSSYIPVVAKEGEVREEYENEIKKIEKEREEEIRASEEFVKRILEEENALQKSLEKDEQIAKELQQQELCTVGDKLSSPTSKLASMMEVWKLPREMKLRSKSTSENHPPSAEDKSKSPLTNWLSKSNEGNRRDSDDRSPLATHKKTPRRSKQEEDDFNMAFRLQRELDLEEKQGRRPKTVSDHFYPLKYERTPNSHERPKKRLKTS